MGTHAFVNWQLRCLTAAPFIVAAKWVLPLPFWTLMLLGVFAHWADKKRIATFCASADGVAATF
jgi:hypothetical protein